MAKKSFSFASRRESKFVNCEHSILNAKENCTLEKSTNSVLGKFMREKSGILM